MSLALAPDDIVRTHEEAQGNAREPLLVLDPLLEFLDSNGLDAPADLAASPIGDGHSNVTFGLSTGVVLRRPPRGPLPPSAHDVLREARLLRALEATPVRVPRVLAVCDDLSVIGAPFYVMERGRGRGDHRRDARAARHAAAAPHGRRRAGRLARRAARGRLDVDRARRVRQADRLSRAPASALQRPLGAQPDAGAPRGRAGRQLARREHAELPAGDDRPRRLPARQHDVRLPRPGASWSRSSTGRWRRSATRSPTSAT